MRYFSYYDLKLEEERIYTVTVSEDDIRKEFYPSWYERMCQKYGKEEVDKNWSFEECLEDWVTTYCAWNSDDEKKFLNP